MSDGVLLHIKPSFNQHSLLHNFQLEAAVADVDELEPSLLGSNARIKMHFLIFEQKFFELLVRNKPLEALNCLRHQISPLRHNFSRVHELSR